MKLKLIIIVTLATLLGGALGLFIGWSSHKPHRHDILIKAKQYSYDPSEIKVNYNDTLYIKLVSLDVVHGFYVEDYDIDAEVSPNVKNFKVRNPSAGFNWRDTSEIVLIANKQGKFRYRCSHTCGNMHPFMQGVIIVKPNIVLHIGIGMVLGFMAGMLAMFYVQIFNTKNKNGE